jgi:hypothetical protein
MPVDVDVLVPILVDTTHIEPHAKTRLFMGRLLSAKCT